ncbi:MAG: MobH family relaxase [Succinimonas sp.]|nr:MobH family relaxase [Succinimonas sp.]
MNFIERIIRAVSGDGIDAGKDSGSPLIPEGKADHKAAGSPENSRQIRDKTKGKAKGSGSSGTGKRRRHSRSAQNIRYSQAPYPLFSGGRTGRLSPNHPRSPYDASYEHLQRFPGKSGKPFNAAPFGRKKPRRGTKSGNFAFGADLFAADAGNFGYPNSPDTGLFSPGMPGRNPEYSGADCNEADPGDPFFEMPLSGFDFSGGGDGSQDDYSIDDFLQDYAPEAFMPDNDRREDFAGDRHRNSGHFPDSPADFPGNNGARAAPSAPSGSLSGDPFCSFEDYLAETRENSSSGIVAASQDKTAPHSQSVSGSLPAGSRSFPGASAMPEDASEYSGRLELKPAEEYFRNLAPLIEEAREHLPLTPEEFQEMVFPLLENTLEYMDALPASECYHHCEPGGLFRHSLETAALTLSYLKRDVMTLGDEPEKRRRKAALYALAVYTGGLLHDAGKAFSDMEVITEKGDAWSPVGESLRGFLEREGSRFYYFRYRPRRGKTHENLTPLLAGRIIPPALLTALMSDPAVYADLFDALYGNAGSPFFSIIKKADSGSVEADLRGTGNALNRFSRKPHALIRLLSLLQNRIRESPVPFNAPGSYLYHIDQRIYLVITPDRFWDLLRSGNDLGINLQIRDLRDLAEKLILLGLARAWRPEEGEPLTPLALNDNGRLRLMLGLELVSPEFFCQNLMIPCSLPGVAPEIRDLLLRLKREDSSRDYTLEELQAMLGDNGERNTGAGEMTESSGESLNPVPGAIQIPSESAVITESSRETLSRIPSPDNDIPKTPGIPEGGFSLRNARIPEEPAPEVPAPGSRRPLTGKPFAGGLLNSFSGKTESGVVMGKPFREGFVREEHTGEYGSRKSGEREALFRQRTGSSRDADSQSFGKALEEILRGSVARRKEPYRSPLPENSGNTNTRGNATLSRQHFGQPDDLRGMTEIPAASQGDSGPEASGTSGTPRETPRENGGASGGTRPLSDRGPQESRIPEQHIPREAGTASNASPDTLRQNNTVNQAQYPVMNGASAAASSGSASISAAPSSPSSAPQVKPREDPKPAVKAPRKESAAKKPASRSSAKEENKRKTASSGKSSKAKKEPEELSESMAEGMIPPFGEGTDIASGSSLSSGGDDDWALNPLREKHTPPRPRNASGQFIKMSEAASQNARSGENIGNNNGAVYYV